MIDIFLKNESHSNFLYLKLIKISKSYCDCLYFTDHYCLVFETLGISLYDLIKRNDYTGFPLYYVKDLSR